MADRWLDGNLPYTVIWDHKPVGIYAIFAGALALFGKSVISIRIAATIFIFLTSLVLYCINVEITKTKNSGIIASMLYPVYSLGLGGAAANTEPFFSLLNMLGLWLLLKVLREKPPTRRFLLLTGSAGLVFGLTLQIKYIVILEIVYFAIAFIPLAISHGYTLRFREWISVSLVIIFGLLVPTAVVFSFYAYHGYADQFIFSNFTANQAHIEMKILLNTFITFARSMEKWSNWVNILLVVSVLGIVIPRFIPRCREDIHTDRGIYIFLFFWLAVSLCECWLTFKFYPHYYLVTIPPLCILTGFSFYRMGVQNVRIRHVIILCLILSFVQLSHIFLTSAKWAVGWEKKDQVTLVAHYIKQNCEPDDYIYVVNDQPIYYFLTGARIPTIYAFPPFIIDPHFSRVADINYRIEIDHILQLKPKYILINRDLMTERVLEVKQLLDEGYFIEKRYRNLDIYRANPS